jgi:L-threonylcarbamoyladenylate synthase
MTDSLIDDAVRLLRAGGVIALPTETVYGLAADASNDDAVRRIYAIKGRPIDHPLIVHLPNRQALPQYVVDPPEWLAPLVNRFWPGPLTVIVRKSAFVSTVVTGGQNTVALRMVDHPLTQAILARFGGAVAAPSANRFGRVSPTTAAHVLADLGSDVDLIVDGGSARIGLESTIVDLTGESPAILRSGAITATAIQEVIGVKLTARAIIDVRAPGRYESHYTPKAKLILVAKDDIAAAIARQEASGERAIALELPHGAAMAAAVLYMNLRMLDDAGYTTIVASLPPDTEEYAAVRDRLTRAASPE